jgi:hypothetical protein
MMHKCWRLGALLLALMSGMCWCAVSATSQVTYGQWISYFGYVLFGQCLQVSQGKAILLEGTTVNFLLGKSDDLPDGVRMHGTVNGNALTLTFTNDQGMVRVHGQAEKATTPYAFICSLPGEELAQTRVGMDAARVRLPATRALAEYPAARHFRFFAEQPARTFGIDMTTCDFADLRDLRTDGHHGFQLYVKPDAAGTLDFTIDLTKSTFLPQPAEPYVGAHLIGTDDLHLPDLALSRNLLQNPGFEGDFALWALFDDDTALFHPSPNPGSGWAVDTTVAHSGTQSARYTIARGYIPPMLCTFPLAVHPGGRYTVSFYARTDTPGAALSLFVQTSEWGQFPLNGPGRYPLTRDWQRVVETFTAPNSFLRLAFGDRWWDGNADGQIEGAHVWLDDVQCEESATVSDFTQKPVFCHATTGCPDECVPLEQPHPALQVTLTNTSEQPAYCAATVSVETLTRTPLLSQHIQAQLAPGQSLVRTISLQKVQARGMLRVEMVATAGAYRETFYGRFTRYARISDAGKMRYMLHQEEPDQQTIDSQQCYGVFGSLSFGLPSNPAICAAAVARNFLLITSPNNEPGCPVKIFTEPMTEEKWQAYGRWLGSKVAPYHDQIYWKTTNEPNCPANSWTPADNVRAVALLRKHVKALNPAALILTPEPNNASSNGASWDSQAWDGLTWMEQFFQAGGNKLVDVVAIHPYRARPESPDLDLDIQKLIALKAQYGLAHAPIMFTEGDGTNAYQLPEIGMSPLGPFYEWRLGLLGLDVGRAEITAAGVMTRMLLLCMKNDDQVKSYLSWRDDIAHHQPMATLGAVNFLLDTLRHADFQHEYHPGGLTKTYLFLTPAQQPVAVCWCHDIRVDSGELPSFMAHMPAPGAGWHLVDLMGNPLKPSVAHGVWSFPVSGLPVYLLGPHGAFPAAQRLLEHLQISAPPVRGHSDKGESKV